MRILLVSSFYPPKFIGGAELIAHEQAKVMAARGHEVRVFCGEPAGDSRYATGDDVFEGIPVRRIRLTAEDSQSERVNFFHRPVNAAFASCLQEWRPDVVYAHNLVGLSAGILPLAAAAGIRTVQMLHDHWGFCFKNTFIKYGVTICSDRTRCYECMPVIQDGRGAGLPIELRNSYIAYALDHADQLVAPSEYLAGRYKAAGFGDSGRVATIAYGIDTARFAACPAPSDEGPVCFTFIGYLGEHKGIWTLAEAARLLARDTSVVIQFAGAGHQEAALKDFAVKHGLHERMQFLGKIPNSAIETVLQRTHALILPSIWPENQPITILEAMAAARPVIASAAGGMIEMVEDGVTGFLIPPGDAHVLAERIRTLAHDATLRRAFGSAGKAKVAVWSLQNQVGLLEQLFTRLLSSPARQPETKIIVCHGLHFSSPARHAIAELAHRPETKTWRFVHIDWLDSSAWDRATVHWVVGDCDHMAVATHARAAGVPLLVPESIEDLVRICRQESAGLCYSDSDEATAALLILLQGAPNSRR